MHCVYSARDESKRRHLCNVRVRGNKMLFKTRSADGRHGKMTTNTTTKTKTSYHITRSIKRSSINIRIKSFAYFALRPAKSRKTLTMRRDDVTLNFTGIFITSMTRYQRTHKIGCIENLIKVRLRLSHSTADYI